MLTDPKPDLMRDDGTLWEASFRDERSAIRALFDPAAPQFFLRRIEPNPARKWWCPWRPRYIRTGETWETHSLFTDGFAFVGEARL